VFDSKVRQIDSFVKKLCIYFLIPIESWRSRQIFRTHLTLHATLVSRDFVTSMMENGRQCRLQYPCNGASRRIITMTAIFVWSMLPVTIRKKIKYLNLLLAIRPVPHGPDLPVPSPPDNLNDESEKSSLQSDTEEMYFEPHQYDRPIDTFTQSELNYLIRELQLTKEMSELLGSRLCEKNMLAFLVQESREIISKILCTGRSTCISYGYS
jgi:hypothetical protein